MKTDHMYFDAKRKQRQESMEKLSRTESVLTSNIYDTKPVTQKESSVIDTSRSVSVTAPKQSDPDLNRSLYLTPVKNYYRKKTG